MADDILAWLRHEEHSWDDTFGPGGGDVFGRAADEIERLRAEVERRTLPPGHHHVTVADDGTWSAEDADDRLRKSIAAHHYLGSLDVMRPIYDTLPVQMRSIIMHVLGEHDDPIGCYEHCALCLAVRSPGRFDVHTAPEDGAR